MEITTIQWEVKTPAILHFKCTCFGFPGPVTRVPTEIEELRLKCAAKCLILGRTPKIVIPDRDEMVGLALLERDDELPKRRK